MPASSTTASSDAADGGHRATDASAPPARDGGEPHAEPGAHGRDSHAGERVVLILFAILAACVVAVFTLFYFVSPAQTRSEFPKLVARNLYIPVVATSLLVGVDAWRHGRSGWWIYVLTAPLPGLNVVLAVKWLTRWRREPRPVGRWHM